MQVMDRLYSPWRAKYIASFGDKGKEEDPCVFCDALGHGDDDEALILLRGKACFVIMNRYPYNSGHLMVLPYRHAAALNELTDEERLDIVRNLEYSMEIIAQAMKPDGFNIGSNLGRVAGAGVVDHIHFHVVPRWNGDTNFMPVLADTKVISEDLNETLLKLRKAASEIAPPVGSSL
jgi:ATP adenylyltransferase